MVHFSLQLISFKKPGLLTATRCFTQATLTRLFNEDLRIGMHIEIPEFIDSTMKADSHRPYGEFIAHMKGSIMPHLKLKELDDNGDETLMIIAAVVTAIVVVTVAQWAGPAAVSYLVEAGVLAEGSTAAGMTGIAASALAAGGTDLALQEVAVQAGIQDHISLEQTGTMMVTAGANAVASLAVGAGASDLVKITAKVIAAGTANVGKQLIEMRAGSRGHLDLVTLATQVVAAYVGAKVDIAAEHASNAVKSAGTSGFIQEAAKNISLGVVNSLAGAAVTHTNPNIQYMAANAIGTTAMDAISSYMQSADVSETANHSAQHAAQEEGGYCAFNPAPASAYEQGVYQEQQHLVQHQAASELSLLASEQVASTLPTIESALGHAGYGAINAVKSMPQVLLEEARMPVYMKAFNSAVGLARTAATLINGDMNAKAEVLGSMVGTAGVTALAGGAVGLAGSRLSFFSPAPRVGMGAQFGEFGFFDVKQPGLNSIPLGRTPDLGLTSTTKEMLSSGAIPGREGVILNQRVVPFKHIWEMSQNAGVEFILTKEEGDFILRSGSGTTSPIKPGVRPIVHTHPKDDLGLNSLLPSKADIQVLNDLWIASPNKPRPVSQILVGEREPTRFYATGLDNVLNPKRYR